MHWPWPLEQVVSDRFKLNTISMITPSGRRLNYKSISFTNKIWTLKCLFQRGLPNKTLYFYSKWVVFLKTSFYFDKNNCVFVLQNHNHALPKQRKRSKKCWQEKIGILQFFGKRGLTSIANRLYATQNICEQKHKSTGKYVFRSRVIFSRRTFPSRKQLLEVHADMSAAHLVVDSVQEMRRARMIGHVEKRCVNVDLLPSPPLLMVF